MKVVHLFFAASLVGAPIAYAQHDHGSASQAQAHHAGGVVKSLNAEKGTVTIAHGPVESLKWPAMTMSFKAKDRKMLDALKAGQKIDFEFIQEGKAYVLTRVQ